MRISRCRGEGKVPVYGTKLHEAPKKVEPSSDESFTPADGTQPAKSGRSRPSTSESGKHRSLHADRPHLREHASLHRYSCLHSVAGISYRGFHLHWSRPLAGAATENRGIPC